jgi:hypothetical protein
MLPRLDLDHDERCRIEVIMLRYLDDKSWIVRTYARQALFDLSVSNLALRQRVLPLLHNLE